MSTDVQSLTVEQFAALPPAWLDTIRRWGGVLVARIHPCHNRADGDEDVLARALVFVPPRTDTNPFARGEEPTRRDGHLARLTNRGAQVTLGGQRGDDYCALLASVCRLPMIRLPRDGGGR